MKLLIVGEWDWEKILLYLPDYIIRDCKVCFPQNKIRKKYKGHSIWDVPEMEIPLETPFPRNMLDAARVNECGMLIAFWDGQQGDISAWITRAKIAKKTTLIVYR